MLQPLWFMRSSVFEKVNKQAWTLWRLRRGLFLTRVFTVTKLHDRIVPTQKVILAANDLSNYNYFKDSFFPVSVQERITFTLLEANIRRTSLCLFNQIRHGYTKVQTNEKKRLQDTVQSLKELGQLYGH